MNINGAQNLLFLGYPEAGKTTFLAALWYLINHSEELDAGLRLSRHNDNAVYLNMITEKWLGYQRMERTKLSQEKQIFIEMQDVQSGRVFGLSFPDLSGERFRQQFEDRHCTNDFVDLVMQSRGCLLFIHVGRTNRAVPISEAVSVIRTLDQQNILPQIGMDKTPEKAIAWDWSMPCIQVKTIELLQFIAHLRTSIDPFRIAIVLSAWDLVDTQQGTPLAFLEKNLPFLNQFVNANSDLFTSRVFGISATGVDLSPDNKDKIESYSIRIYKHTDRIKVKINDNNLFTHDITMPIKWVLEK